MTSNSNFAAATTPFASSSSMKLVISTTAGAERVLFAEAGKDVADFILGLVAMPLGAVDRLLLPEGGSPLGGSIGNVYASVENMDAAYMQSRAARDTLLVAPAPAPLPSTPFSPPNTSSSNALPHYLYRCDACQASRLPPGSSGFVKDMAKYTVMDDLTVKPTTNVSCVALLKSLGVKDLDALEERTVNVGRKEALDILKAALHSKTVLTDVFLKSKRAHNAHFSNVFSNVLPTPSFS